MKILKIIGLSIAGVIALALIVALFVSSKYQIEREVTINKPKQQVFGYVKYLKNQNEFSVWAKIDPGMKTEFRGEDGTEGFVSAWDSQNPKAGKGEQKIVKISGEDRIDYEIHFIKPMESTDYAYMTFGAVNDSTTKVNWVFHGQMSYPMNLMCLFMDFEKMLGPDLQNGLNNLKGILER